MSKVEPLPDIPALRRALRRKIEKELNSMKTATAAELLSEINEAYLLEDEQFILSVYKTLLQRVPDSSGYSHFHALLSKGKMSRDTVFYALYSSDECRKRPISIPHLFRRHLRSKLVRIPVIGFIFGFLDAIASAAKTKKNICQVNISIHSLERKQTEISTTFSRIEKGLTCIESRMNEIDIISLQQRFYDKIAQIEARLDALERENGTNTVLLRQSIDDRFGQVESRIEGLDKNQSSCLDLTKLRMETDRLLDEMHTFKRAWFNGSQHEAT